MSPGFKSLTLRQSEGLSKSDFLKSFEAASLFSVSEEKVIDYTEKTAHKI